MAYGTGRHLLFELCLGETGADLLLEREASAARVLDAAHFDASTRSQTAVSAMGNASIANPGLTPVPSTATLAFSRTLVESASPATGWQCAGYASSSVVDTIGTRCFSSSSICGITFLSDDERAEHGDVGLRRLDRLAEIAR